VTGLGALSLRVRIFLFFAALAAGAVTALIAALWFAYARLADPSLLNAFVQVGLLAGLAILGGLAWVWSLFDMHVAKPIDILAGALRARAHSDGGGALDGQIARYLGDLAPAARAAATRLDETQSALAMAVARETTRLATEKARLETLLADVPVAVLLVTETHGLAFYNGPATEMLGAAAHRPGLDRGLFDLLRPGPVLMAHDRLTKLDDAEAATDFLCTTADGGRLLSARMRLVGEGEGLTGYVLTLRDVSAEAARHRARDGLIDELMDRVRRPAAALLALIEAPARDGDTRPAVALRAEAERLARNVTDVARQIEAAGAPAWPLPLTRAADLVEGLRARLDAAGLTLDAMPPSWFLRCNGYEIVLLLAGLAQDIAGAGLARAFSLTMTEEEGGAALHLGWQGAALPMGQLERWLDATLDPDLPALGLRRGVLAAHRTDAWSETRAVGPETRAGVLVPILQIRQATRRPAPITRRVAYDFDLLTRPRVAALSEAPLDQLTYVVFDTETTGLLPDQGDEIVQIAALRIVNGRRVVGELLDLLVNPGRSIPRASTEVHGISDAMVAGAPDVVTALRRFHQFADGAVLVAHNAPFDMTFLKRREAALGLRFDHPVLDTVLLSAVVYGQHETHSLDALSHRLGITIPEEARHTAIGDTEATAEAFLRLIAALKGREMATFGAVLTEVRRHGRLLRDLNA
jgi:DNA polymerase-3 subunit epsilon